MVRPDSTRVEILGAIAACHRRATLAECATAELDDEVVTVAVEEDTDGAMGAGVYLSWRRAKSRTCSNRLKNGQRVYLYLCKSADPSHKGIFLEYKSNDSLVEKACVTADVALDEVLVAEKSKV